MLTMKRKKILSQSCQEENHKMQHCDDDHSPAERERERELRTTKSLNSCAEEYITM